MAAGKTGWNDCKGIARAILHDRAARRRVIGRILLAALLAMAAGLWLVDGWLESSALLFLAWWGGCALLTCLAMLFAVYDALAVIREERGGRL
jgi:hypothetical protein